MKYVRILMQSIILISALMSGCGNSNKTDETSHEATLDLSGSKQGQSVGFADVDGDGKSDKIVGAPYAESKAGNTGAVIVYKGSDTGFSSIPTSVFLGDDNLGYAVINTGDLDDDDKDDLAVGAIHGDGEDVSLSGSVTIYKGGSDGEIIKKIPGEWPLDKFGFSLASGDLNDDGHRDLVVGAPFNTNNPSLYQAGAVYVFYGPAFTSVSRLYANSINKGLGWAVATGDTNGDLVDDLIISATGKILLFRGNSTFAPETNSPDAVIKGTAAGFGKAISVVADLDGISGGEIAIGAPNAVLTLAGVSSRDVGSVYLVSAPSATNIDVNAGTPAGSLVGRIDGETLFSRFGSSVTLLGDVDGGGKKDMAVGAPMLGVDWMILSGGVYLFKGEDLAANDPWSHSSIFTGMVMNQGYGTSIAFSNNALLIGAPRSNSDTGGADMVNPATGHAVPGGSSGGSSGGSGECH